MINQFDIYKKYDLLDITHISRENPAVDLSSQFLVRGDPTTTTRICPTTTTPPPPNCDFCKYTCIEQNGSYIWVKIIDNCEDDFYCPLEDLPLCEAELVGTSIKLNCKYQGTTTSPPAIYGIFTTTHDPRPLEQRCGKCKYRCMSMTVGEGGFEMFFWGMIENSCKKTCVCPYPTGICDRYHLGETQEKICQHEEDFYKDPEGTFKCKKSKRLYEPCEEKCCKYRIEPSGAIYIIANDCETWDRNCVCPYICHVYPDLCKSENLPNEPTTLVLRCVGSYQTTAKPSHVSVGGPCLYTKEWTPDPCATIVNFRECNCISYCCYSGCNNGSAVFSWTGWSVFDNCGCNSVCSCPGNMPGPIGSCAVDDLNSYEYHPCVVTSMPDFDTHCCYCCSDYPGCGFMVYCPLGSDLIEGGPGFYYPTTNWCRSCTCNPSKSIPPGFDFYGIPCYVQTCVPASTYSGPGRAYYGVYCFSSGGGEEWDTTQPPEPCSGTCTFQCYYDELTQIGEWWFVFSDCSRYDCECQQPTVPCDSSNAFSFIETQCIEPPTSTTTTTAAPSATICYSLSWHCCAEGYCPPYLGCSQVNSCPPCIQSCIVVDCVPCR
jgi:hypothetical protein